MHKLNFHSIEVNFCSVRVNFDFLSEWQITRKFVPQFLFFQNNNLLEIIDVSLYEISRELY